MVKKEKIENNLKQKLALSKSKKHGSGKSLLLKLKIEDIADFDENSLD